MAYKGIFGSTEMRRKAREDLQIFPPVEENKEQEGQEED